MPSPSRTSLLLAPSLLVSMSLAHAVDVWTVGIEQYAPGLERV